MDTRFAVCFWISLRSLPISFGFLPYVAYVPFLSSKLRRRPDPLLKTRNVSSLKQKLCAAWRKMGYEAEEAMLHNERIASVDQARPT